MAVVVAAGSSSSGLSQYLVAVVEAVLVAVVESAFMGQGLGITAWVFGIAQDVAHCPGGQATLLHVEAVGKAVRVAASVQVLRTAHLSHAWRAGGGYDCCNKQIAETHQRLFVSCLPRAGASHNRDIRST